MSLEWLHKILLNSGILDARHISTLKPFVKFGIRNLPIICERNVEEK